MVDVMPPSTELVVASRVERALVALAAHAQQLEDRLARIEDRVEGLVGAQIDVATQADLTEVRVHSARVANEVHKLEAVMRSELERVELGRLTPNEQRIRTLAEQILDLNDGMDTRPGDLPGEGPGLAAIA